MSRKDKGEGEAGSLHDHGGIERHGKRICGSGQMASVNHDGRTRTWKREVMDRWELISRDGKRDTEKAGFLFFFFFNNKGIIVFFSSFFI